MRRSLSAVGGMRTASNASHALADAIRWLTGQMPQMRAIKRRHLGERPAFAEFLEAAELGDVKVRVFDAAIVVEVQRDLGVPFDAGHRVDHDRFWAWLAHG